MPPKIRFVCLTKITVSAAVIIEIKAKSSMLSI